MKLLIFGCLFLLGAHSYLGSQYDAGIVDDTLIFLRYAENAVTGIGVVFNQGDMVEGYTSPLWLLALVIGSVFSSELPSMAVVLSSFFGIASVIALFTSGKSESDLFLPFCAGLTLCAAPPFIFWTHSGMGTALFAFLLTTFFLYLERDCNSEERPLRSGLLLSLCILSRPEAVALAPLATAWLYFLRKKEKLRSLCFFLAPLLLVALHLIWRLSYYGSILPNTYFAKAGIPLDSRLLAGITYSMRFFTAYYLHFFVFAIGLILTTGSLLRARFAQTKYQNLNLASLFVTNWLLIVIFSGGDHFAMYRFFVPILPIITLIGLRLLTSFLEDRKLPQQPKVYLILGSLCSLALFIHFRRSDIFSIVEALLIISAVGLLAFFYRHSAIIRRLLPHNSKSITAGLLFLLAFTLNYQLTMRSQDARKAKIEVKLVDTWSTVGRWLKNNVPEDTKIASITAGAIPFYSKLKTLDLVGLTDKTIAKRGNIHLDAAPGHQKYLSEYVLRSRPDIIVHPSAAATKDKLDYSGSNLVPTWHYSIIDLLKQQEMLDQYSLKQAKLKDGTYMVLFVRNDFDNFPKIEIEQQ
jgi:hypothetical protein